nr:hypothetical protein [Escherichia coli]
MSDYHHGVQVLEINDGTRVDESLAALYGDIGKQAESLIGKAGSMATRFTGMTGAG